MYCQPKDTFAIAMDIRSKINTTLSSQQIANIRIGSENETLTIFWDQFGLPSGYILWAKLCRESVHRFGRCNLVPQHAYEWKEGYVTTIFDVAFIGGLKPDNRRALTQFVKSKRLFAFKRGQKTKLYKNLGNLALLTRQ